MTKKKTSQKRKTQAVNAPATSGPPTEAGLSKAELKAKLERLALMVKTGNLKLVADLIAGATDAWLFEALLAGSSINGLHFQPGKALKRFNKPNKSGQAYGTVVGLVALGYAPDGAKLDASLKNKNQELEVQVRFSVENLEPITACLTEHLYPHFPDLKLVSEGSLNLYGLTTLSDAAAESLSKHEGELDLRGLRELSDAAAESLSKYQGKLWLGGLTELSDAAAESLSKHQGDLDLDGLTELSDAAAESLSKHQGDLDLRGLRELSDAAAESLSKHQGYLYLNGLTELSDAAAESLSKHQGTLDLDGLTELSDAAAESLSKHQGWLVLDGLTELSDAAAESLSKHQGPLGLRGLTELSDAAAESLSKHQGTLGLRGLTELSDAAAESLSKLQGWLGLWGLTELSDAAAESLSKHQGDLDLCGLTELSDAAAESLSKHQGWLVLDGLTELSDAAAESLSKHQGTLGLRGLTELSDAAAKSLSKHQGDLTLSGLTELSDAAAESLSKHQGGIEIDDDDVRARIDSFKSEEEDDDEDSKDEEGGGGGGLVGPGAELLEAALASGEIEEATRLRQAGNRIHGLESFSSFLASTCEDRLYSLNGKQVDPDLLPRIVSIQEVIANCGPIYDVGSTMSFGERPAGWGSAAAEDRILSWRDAGYGLVGDQTVDIDTRYITARPLTAYRDAIVAGPLDASGFEPLPEELAVVKWEGKPVSFSPFDSAAFRRLYVRAIQSKKELEWNQAFAAKALAREAVMFYVQSDQAESHAEILLALGTLQWDPKEATAKLAKAAKLDPALGRWAKTVAAASGCLAATTPAKWKKALAKLKTCPAESQLEQALVTACETLMAVQGGAPVALDALEGWVANFRDLRSPYVSWMLERACDAIVEACLQAEENLGEKPQLLQQAVRCGFRGACGPLAVAACHVGNESLLEHLLTLGFSVQGRYLNGLCLVPLATAVNSYNLVAVRLLLKHGADPLQPSHYGGATPAECAWQQVNISVGGEAAKEILALFEAQLGKDHPAFTLSDPKSDS